ncbi:MAG TPA: hypothetical protein VMS99_16620 [Acidimicrobiia bacterium]|nr:hypothetical protein [Acidimicrobiia bacterium]
MDRNVLRHKRGIAGTETLEDEPPAHEKLLKYFPEAALALYIGADPLIRQAASGNALKVVLWLALGAVIVFCWIYLSRTWKVDAVSQKLISVTALVLYVAAIGGPFTATFSGYKTVWASILALFFTAFMAFGKAPTEP